ncbi:MAG: acetolactate synthase small subunit [Bacteroidaceae bacterium]|nr:acetolactate synthase small subunit [Bacteroidaceae bacterium]
MEENTTQNICQPSQNDCSVCGKCTTREEEARRQGLTLYTILVYSENIAGVLNQITAVFTRRQVNIESLNVCASSTPGVHKYTITCYCTLEMVKMLKKQIEKRIDVIQARYFTDEEIFILETSLLKISTPMMLDNADVCRMVRLHGARIVEVNPTYSTVEKTGMTEDILKLYESLNSLGVVLQFVRSGRICITKSYTEQLDAYLAEREAERANG